MIFLIERIGVDAVKLHIAGDKRSQLGTVSLCTKDNQIEDYYRLHLNYFIHGDEYKLLCQECCDRMGLSIDGVLAVAALEKL